MVFRRVNLPSNLKVMGLGSYLMFGECAVVGVLNLWVWGFEGGGIRRNEERGEVRVKLEKAIYNFKNSGVSQFEMI